MERRNKLRRGVEGKMMTRGGSRKGRGKETGVVNVRDWGEMKEDEEEEGQRKEEGVGRGVEKR